MQFNQSYQQNQQLQQNQQVVKTGSPLNSNSVPQISQQQQSQFQQQLQQQQQQQQLQQQQYQLQQQQQQQQQQKYSLYQVPSFSSQVSQQQQFNNVQVISQQQIFFEPISCIVEATETEGGIYLSNLEAAADIELLTKLNIRSVMTVAAKTGLKYPPNSILFHELIDADDVEQYDLLPSFQQCFTFFDKARQHGNVLCHCFAGVSRSATIVIAYLMKNYQKSFEESLNLVRNKRSQIYPNPGFVKQLKQFEQELSMGGKSSSSTRSSNLTAYSYQQKQDVYVVPQSYQEGVQQMEGREQYQNTRYSATGSVPKLGYYEAR